MQWHIWWCSAVTSDRSRKIYGMLVIQPRSAACKCPTHCTTIWALYSMYLTTTILTYLTECSAPAKLDQSRHILSSKKETGWHCASFLRTNLSSHTDIDQLITISGMVIRTSQLIPEMQEAFFQCQVCMHTARVEIDRGRIAEPCVCEHCHTTHSMALIHNRSMFSDKQMVCPLACWVFFLSSVSSKKKFNMSICETLNHAS